GVDVTSARASVDVPGAQWDWLAPGFPDADTPTSQSSSSLSSLVRELDATLPAATALTVVVPQELGGLDAERLELGGAVAWRVVAGRPPAASTTSWPAALAVSVRADAANEAERAVVRALQRAWKAEGHAVTLDVAAPDVALPDRVNVLVWLGSP